MCLRIVVDVSTGLYTKESLTKGLRNKTNASVNRSQYVSSIFVNMPFVRIRIRSRYYHPDSASLILPTREYEIEYPRTQNACYVDIILHLNSNNYENKLVIFNYDRMNRNTNNRIIITIILH